MPEAERAFSAALHSTYGPAALVLGRVTAALLRAGLAAAFDTTERGLPQPIPVLYGHGVLHGLLLALAAPAFAQTVAQEIVAGEGRYSDLAAWLDEQRALLARCSAAGQP
jgi:hypothetical protein